jgi:IPT/TIG domain/Regulator of chromosome condensation (RCC1) repeat
VSAISASRQLSVALLNSGSVEAWGINRWGTLGDGVTGEPSDVPVTVNGLRKVASISAGGFHVLAFGEPIPAVSGVSPNTGPKAGGATVTITGAELTGASAVSFGGVEATDVEVESASMITAVAPPGTGVVDVTVTTPSGTSPVGPSDRYSYVSAPTVTKLSAKGGSAAGGTPVTITGTGFAAGSSVSFGGAPAANPTVNSPSSITVVSPPQTAGTVDVTVTSTGGASAATSKDHFKYSPTVEGVTPNTGSALGGTSVTVTGSGYVPGTTATTFKFGKGKATAVSCTSATTCTMTAPAQAAGTVDVIATVNKLKSPLNAPLDQFSYS